MDHRIGIILLFLAAASLTVVDLLAIGDKGQDREKCYKCADSSGANPCDPHENVTKGLMIECALPAHPVEPPTEKINLTCSLVRETHTLDGVVKKDYLDYGCAYVMEDHCDEVMPDFVRKFYYCLWTCDLSICHVDPANVNAVGF